MSTLIGYLLLVSMGVLLMGAITRPTWALSLLLVQYPLEQLIQSYVIFFVQRNELFNVIIGLLAITSLGLKLFSRHNPLQASLNSVGSLCILYYALASVSILWSPTQQDAFEILRPGLSYVLMFIILGPLLIDRIDEVREFFIVTLVLSTIIAIMVLTSPNGEFIRGRFNLRLGGVGLKESNPLAMSDLGAFLVLAAVTLNLTRKSILILFARVVGGIVGTGLLLASSSRGQVVAAGMVALIFYPVSVQVKSLYQFIVRATLFIALTFMLLIGASVFKGQSAGTEKRWDSAELSDASAIRFENIGTLLIEFGKRPKAWALGLGTGGFAAYEKSAHEPYVHNMIIESLGEFGIVGFLVFMAMLYATTTCAVRLLKLCWDDPDTRATAASLVAINVFQFLISNKQGNVWVSTQMFTTFLLMARVERIATSESLYTDPISEVEDSAGFGHVHT